ncbi:MAG: protein-(glutamine-N5) methyltransferase, release factor-specific [Acidimicrobiaceae bacterium]|nr:protein-(glutamine-N5) methyltransferase, release factor-specific [Acidimicrobiaceae bacterium]
MSADADDAGDAADVLTLRRLWQQTADVLGSRHEARWICEVATALDGDEFEAALDQPVTERMVQHHDAMVARYRSGEPLQYVLGRWGFRRLDLAVDRRVLIPRPETELVVESVLDLVRDLPHRRIADLGTGSGAIGLALADELPLDGTEIWLSDADGDALDVARANLAGIGRAARNVRVNQGDWFEALPDGDRFDVIVSNPPYVADGSELLDASVREWEPAVALFAGADGLDDYRRIVPGASEHLTTTGSLVLEIGTDQGAAVRSMCLAAGFRTVDVRPDLAGHDRLVIATR